MPKMIQIRDVPDQVHSILKARAAKQGISLSEYLKKELGKITAQPTMEEWLELTRHSKPIPSKRSAAEIIRELRGDR
ncbi:MAG: hypothetical protein IT168_27420 [Bryobacterales bacterium]|nr:hypothetical protein [Bryobacterales bacterium]